MATIRDSRNLFNSASIGFPEFFLTHIGSDGRLPFWFKCIVFSALLYGLGILANFVSNTLFLNSETSVKTPYLMDYSFMVVCVVLGFTPVLLFSTLRKLDEAFMQVNKRIGATSTSEDEKKFMEFVSWMKQWMPMGKRFFERPAFWYYLETIGGAILGALFAIYWIIYSTGFPWINIQYGVSALYFIFFCAVIAYVIGVVIFATVGAVQAVRRYCKDFIKKEKVLALNPDRVGGLKPLGQFSLGLDIAFALPSFVVFSYLAQGVSISNPMVAATLILYTFILIVVFFIPLSAAHDSMLAAKEKAYDQVNEIFKEVNSQITKKDSGFDFKRIKTLEDTYFLYDKISKMSVWPLNLGILLKFVATASFPIVGSLIVEYVSKVFNTLVAVT